jgi:dsRNA-specific ribonuclease
LPEYVTADTPVGFECTLTVRIEGAPYTFSGMGTDKRLAEQAAAKAARQDVVLPSLLSSPPKIANVPPRPIKRSAAEKTQAHRKETNSNPIVQLQNKAFEWHGNKFGTDNTQHTPRYEYIWTNTDPKTPEFECTVHVIFKDGSARPFSATGSSKANAKRAAAEAANNSIASDED